MKKSDSSMIKKKQILRLTGFKRGTQADRHLLVNVSKTVQNFPEESPQSVLVLVQAMIYRVPQSAFFTVFHLSGTEIMT